MLYPLKRIAPSLYAINNIYTLINKFIEKKKEESLTKLEFRIDYCEISKSFRHFLHYFTECLNDKRKCNKTNSYQIPYHFGSYDDFKNMNVSVNDNIRFDIAIFNNFLTPNTRFESFKKNIIGIIECLTNKGLLIIFGPNLKGKSKYVEYYNNLHSFLCSYQYKTKSHRWGYLSQIINYPSVKTSLNQQNKNDISNFYENILAVLFSSPNLTMDYKTQFKNKARENPRIKDSWSAMIYQKKFRR